MPNLVQLGPQYFPMSSIGTPVGAGNLYIGNIDTDPTIVGNQKLVNSLQEDGSFIAMSQPIDLSAGGIPLYNGSPVTLYTSGDYSMAVLDINDAQVYYVPSTPGVAIVPGNYYYPDATELDQGVTGEGSTFKAYIDTIGVTNKATIYFRHDSGNEFTNYILLTALDLTLYPNITVELEPGAVFKPAAATTLTFFSPERVVAVPQQQIVDITNNSTDPIMFTEKGTVYPEWWGAKGDGSTDDTVAIQSMFEASLDGYYREMHFVMTGYYITSAPITFGISATDMIIDGKVTGSIVGDHVGAIFEFTNGFSYSEIRDFHQIRNLSVASGSYVLYVPDGKKWISAKIRFCSLSGGYYSFYGRGNVIAFDHVDFYGQNYADREVALYLNDGCHTVTIKDCVFNGAGTHSFANVGTTGSSEVTIISTHFEGLVDSKIYWQNHGTLTIRDSYIAFSPTIDLSYGTVIIHGGMLVGDNIFVETASRVAHRGMIKLYDVNMRAVVDTDNYIVNDGSFSIINNEQFKEETLINPEFTPTIDTTEVLDEVDFATHAKWDVTGDVDDSLGYARFLFAAGSLNGTLKQTNANQASAAANTNSYLFDYTITEITAPDGDFTLIITGDTGLNTEIPNHDVNLPITPGRHRVAFLTDAASATSDFTITAAETTATQGEFRIDDVSLKQVTDINGWNIVGAYWPDLSTPPGVYADINDRGNPLGGFNPLRDEFIMDAIGTSYAISQEYNFKSNTTYRLDVEILSADSKNHMIRIIYWDGAAWATIRTYDLGNTTVQEKKKISFYFTLSVVEAARYRTSIWLASNLGGARYYRPQLFDCGDFVYGVNDAEYRSSAYYPLIP